jgi:DNA repair photolyase
MTLEVEFEGIRTKQLLNRVKAPSMPFEWSINPYRGCQHGCSFCYARSTHSFLGMETDDTFQKHILLKTNAADALREQLHKLSKSKNGLKGIGRIAIGTATDPYQPVEAQEKLTRQCLEVLAEYKVPVGITTRSPLVLRDLDLLKKLNLISVNLSINTLDNRVWRALEPMTPSPAKRLETVKTLVGAGIPAGIFMAPIIPMLTDGEDQVEALLNAASEAGAGFVMPSYLRLATQEVKLWFFRTLEQHFPELTGKYGELYSGSGYLPRSYKEPIERKIHAMLAERGLRIDDPYSGPNSRMNGETVPQPADGPVQLSFSF